MSGAQETRQRGVFGRMAQVAARHRASFVTLGIGAVLAALLLYALLHTARQPVVHQAPVITMVIIQPPKPPPPPPPLPQPKMITQPKMTVPEQKPQIPNQPPKAAPTKPAGRPAPALGTSIHNNGPADSFDLSGDTSGNGLIGGGGGGGGGGSRWGYYAGMVQSQIEAALSHNPVTRDASAGLEVRIWADAGGLVTRVALVKSSGDPAVDSAIENDVLAHMQLQPPPSDMPMPMVMSLTGQSAL